MLFTRKIRFSKFQSFFKEFEAKCFESKMWREKNINWIFLASSVKCKLHQVTVCPEHYELSFLRTMIREIHAARVLNLIQGLISLGYEREKRAFLFCCKNEFSVLKKMKRLFHFKEENLIEKVNILNKWRNL